MISLGVNNRNLFDRFLTLDNILGRQIVTMNYTIALFPYLVPLGPNFCRHCNHPEVTIAFLL